MLYEDDHLLAVDKAAGVVVHPTYRHAHGTLLDRLFWRARDWPAGSRPSIVGRLDQFTSGLVLVAKRADVHAALQRQQHDALKAYLAVVYGIGPPSPIEIAHPLALKHGDRRIVVVREDGSPSRTRVRTLAAAAAPPVGLSLLQCELITGRRHQIRVHLAAEGWPIVGDPRYGQARCETIGDPDLSRVLREFWRPALHAWRIELQHPITGVRLRVEAELPIDLEVLLTAAGLGLRFV